MEIYYTIGHAYSIICLGVLAVASVYNIIKDIKNWKEMKQDNK